MRGNDHCFWTLVASSIVSISLTSSRIQRDNPPNSDEDCDHTSLEFCFKETFVKFAQRPKRGSTHIDSPSSLHESHGFQLNDQYKTFDQLIEQYRKRSSRTKRRNKQISCREYSELNQCFRRRKIHATCSSDKLGFTAMISYQKFVENKTETSARRFGSHHQFIAIIGHLMRTCNKPRLCSQALVIQCEESLKKADKIHRKKSSHGAPYDQYQAFRLELAAVQKQINSHAIDQEEGCTRLQSTLRILHQYHSEYCGHRPQDITSCICDQWKLRNLCGTNDLCRDLPGQKVSFTKVFNTHLFSPMKKTHSFSCDIETVLDHQSIGKIIHD